MNAKQDAEQGQRPPEPEISRRGEGVEQDEGGAGNEEASEVGDQPGW